MAGQTLAGAVHKRAYQELLSALIDLRLKVGISQAELASRLGKPPSFVGKYELGERRLDIIETIIIVKQLNMTIGEFLDQIQITMPSKL